MNREAAEKRGRGAETLACWWLRFHGWRSRHHRPPRQGSFVEVKARATEESAAMSLDAWRLRRVVVAAERLAPRFLKPGDDLRIDAVFIVPRRLPRHMPNVWHG